MVRCPSGLASSTFSGGRCNMTSWQRLLSTQLTSNCDSIISFGLIGLISIYGGRAIPVKKTERTPALFCGLESFQLHLNNFNRGQR